MYCPNCAKEVKEGLRYCSACGMRVADDTSEGARTENVTTAIGFIGVFGILGFVGLVKVLLDSSLDSAAVVVILLAYLAAIFGICYFLIQSISKPSPVEKKDPRDATSELPAPETNLLEESRTEPASVVEQTTRSLEGEPVRRD